MGSAAAAHGLGCSIACGSSRIRDWTPVLCIGRWIPSHWTTRESIDLLSQTFFFFCIISPLRRLFRHSPPKSLSWNFNITSISYISLCILCIHKKKIFPFPKNQFSWLIGFWSHSHREGMLWTMPKDLGLSSHPHVSLQDKSLQAEAISLRHKRPGWKEMTGRGSDQGTLQLHPKPCLAVCPEIPVCFLPPHYPAATKDNIHPA